MVCAVPGFMFIIIYMYSRGLDIHPVSLASCCVRSCSLTQPPNSPHQGSTVLQNSSPVVGWTNMSCLNLFCGTDTFPAVGVSHGDARGSLACLAASMLMIGASRTNCSHRAWNVKTCEQTDECVGVATQVGGIKEHSATTHYVGPYPHQAHIVSREESGRILPTIRAFGWRGWNHLLWL